MEEILGNLLDNACKWAVREVTVTGGAGSRAGFIAIEIGDDGPGIPPEERERVLGRGERLDESQPGSGLGLHIVAGVVKLYQGRLTIDARVGGGTLARVELPGG